MSDISKIKLPNGDIYNLKDNEALHKGDATTGAIQGITKQGGSIVTITNTANNYPLEKLKVSFEPYQEGFGDPSPTNIRSISGWDGLSVYRSGKNLFVGRLVNKNVNANGSEGDSTNRLGTLFEPIKAGTYTLSFDSNFSCALYVFSSDQVGTQITEESNIYWNASPLTFNIINGKYYRIKFKHNEGETIIPSDLTDVQLEVGSTATPYEPYTATSYPVTWQSVGTIYGGYVDLVSGVLVAEWGYIASYNGEMLPNVWLSDKDVYVQGTTPTTGAQVAYQLATPITYSITSTEIKTFSGINNFWSNIGTISSITYAQDTKSFIQDYSVKDVQIDNTSIINNGIASIPIASTQNLGLIKIPGYGFNILANGTLELAQASDNNVKNGSSSYTPIVPNNQHKAVFYGLAKASGDATQSASNNAVGTYTDEAKGAIQHMIGTDTVIAPYEADATADRSYAIGGTFMMNGKLYKTTTAIAQGGIITPNSNCVETNIDENYIKNTDYATANVAGVVKISDGSHGLYMRNGELYVRTAYLGEIKTGTSNIWPIVPGHQHESTFYGLAKAAGDTTQSASNNAVGTYTNDAKIAIQNMLGISTIDEIITGTTPPTINAVANHRYKCGEVSILNFTPCAEGMCELIFTSGNTATVLNLPSTVKMPDWFNVEVNRIYDIIITDGIYGVATSWAI